MKIYKKRKLKIKAVISILLYLVFVIIIIQVLQSEEKIEATSEPIIQNKEEIEVEEIEEQTEEILLEIKEPEEDKEIKQLIEEIQIQNNLTENNFSFFYYNKEENKYYFYNQDKYYTAASTVKLPVAMLYYDMINNGELTGNDTIIYTSSCYEEGGGSTASTYSVGQGVPISFLLKQSIVNSDNTAVNILIKNIGWTKYRYDIAEYSDEVLIEDFYKSNLISAAYGYDLINYLYESKESYQELIENMKQSSYGEYLKKYLDCEVAHKYGSYSGYVHDYGIVFGENSDYLIGVFTKNVSDADELIAQINLEVYELKNK